MGYNTVAVILNDALSFMRDDPQFGGHVSAAVMSWPGRRGDRSSLSVSARSVGENGSTGVHCNALSIISQDHASGEQVVVVRHNTGCRVDEANNLGWQALDAMKACLERHGYKVTKRRKQNTATRPDPTP